MRMGKNIINRTLLPVIFITTLLLVLPSPAQAEWEIESNFSIIISEVRVFELGCENVSPNPGATALLTGLTEQNPIDVTISTNVAWLLTIRGSDPFWEAPWQKPVSDMQFSYDGGEFQSIGLTAATVTGGEPADHEIYTVNLRASLDPLYDIPGEYSYNYIIFEIETP